MGPGAKFEYGKYPESHELGSLPPSLGDKINKRQMRPIGGAQNTAFYKMPDMCLVIIFSWLKPARLAFQNLSTLVYIIWFATLGGAWAKPSGPNRWIPSRHRTGEFFHRWDMI